MKDKLSLLVLLFSFFSELSSMSKSNYVLLRKTHGHFSDILHLPHSIIEPMWCLFIYLKDLVWCIPQLSVLIKQCKEIMAQRRYSCQREVRKHVSSQGYKLHAHSKNTNASDCATYTTQRNWHWDELKASMRKTWLKGRCKLHTGWLHWFSGIKQSDISAIPSMKLMLKLWFCWGPMKREWREVLTNFIFSRSQ